MLRAVTRRYFFKQAGFGIGAAALSPLLQPSGFAGNLSATARSLVWRPIPLAPKPPMFAAKAKSVIYLFMAGAPSQVDLFDYKPKLQQVRRSAHSPGVAQRRAIRLHQGRAEAAGLAVRISSSAAIGR